MTTDLHALLGNRYDDVIERAARAHALIEPGEDWPTNSELGGSQTGTRDDEYRAGMREEAEIVLAAVLPALLDAEELEELKDEFEQLRAENERLIERGWQDEREFHRLRTKIQAVKDLASYWETTPALRRGAAARELRKAVETEPDKAYGSVSFVQTEQWETL